MQIRKASKQFPNQICTEISLCTLECLRLELGNGERE